MNYSKECNNDDGKDTDPFKCNKDISRALHELTFSWLSWLAVLLMGVYAQLR